MISSIHLQQNAESGKYTATYLTSGISGTVHSEPGRTIQEALASLILALDEYVARQEMLDEIDSTP